MIPPHIKSLILDMDGVLWKGDSPIGDLPAIFQRLEQRGFKVAFATNNGTRTPDQYVERLAGFGVRIDPWQVITSAFGVVSMLRDMFPHGCPVFAIGETGVFDALHENGFDTLPIDQAGSARAVIMGLDRNINFEKMREATLLVRNGIPFFATNDDKTFPTPRGEIPGAGAWLAVVTTASGKQPQIAGKPSTLLMDIARERLGTIKSATLVVGDRLETDIAAGYAAGCPTALVLSGVCTLGMAQKWGPHPDYIFNDLEDLLSNPSPNNELFVK